MRAGDRPSILPRTCLRGTAFGGQTFDFAGPSGGQTFDFAGANRPSGRAGDRPSILPGALSGGQTFDFACANPLVAHAGLEQTEREMIGLRGNFIAVRARSRCNAAAATGAGPFARRGARRRPSGKRGRDDLSHAGTRGWESDQDRADDFCTRGTGVPAAFTWNGRRPLPLRKRRAVYVATFCRALPYQRACPSGPRSSVCPFFSFCPRSTRFSLHGPER